VLLFSISVYSKDNVSMMSESEVKACGKKAQKLCPVPEKSEGKIGFLNYTKCIKKKANKLPKKCRTLVAGFTDKIDQKELDQIDAKEIKKAESENACRIEFGNACPETILIEKGTSGYHQCYKDKVSTFSPFCKKLARNELRKIAKHMKKKNISEEDMKVYDICIKELEVANKECRKQTSRRKLRKKCIASKLSSKCSDFFKKNKGKFR
jgi:hypothetical protein